MHTMKSLLMYVRDKLIKWCIRNIMCPDTYSHNISSIPVHSCVCHAAYLYIVYIH